jgi:hypothetical protein
MDFHSLWTNERVLVPVNAKTPYPGAADGKLNPEYDTVFEHMTALTYVSAITSPSGWGSASSTFRSTTR